MIVVNDGAVQRSRVTKVSVPAADYPGGAFLFRADGLKVIPDAAVVGDQLVLTFATDPHCEYGSLPDGRYWVVPAVSHFHRLFGDGDGDAAVTPDDYEQFGATYGLTSSQTGFKPEFDYNADGTVGGSDFTEFNARYGTGL